MRRLEGRQKDEERFMMFNDFNFCGQEEKKEENPDQEEDKSPELSVYLLIKSFSLFKAHKSRRKQRK